VKAAASQTVIPALEPGPALFFTPDVERQPCVYILARASHSTLYTGVTSDLLGRIYEHREGLAAGFTKRYGIKRLVWFEVHDTMEQAIVREKRIKRWPRAWKYDRIHAINPTWRDLAEDFGFTPLPLR
jgi:putative endonuclease